MTAQPLSPVCGRCRHRVDDRQVLETEIPGLSAFGSAFGASVGTTRLCRRHDRLVSPHDACGDFAAETALD